MYPEDESAATLSPQARTMLDGSRVSAQPHTAFILASAATNGWPHVALLSKGEVVMVAEGVLRIALHSDSRTTANLTETGRATLLLVGPDAVETIEIFAHSVGASEVAGVPLSLFEAGITRVQKHAVPYATVTSGITFELHDAGSTIDRWSETVALLRGKALP